MPKHLSSLALLTTILASTCAVAAEPLSLDAALRHALSQNPELRAAGQQAQAADARAAAAKGAFLPQLGVRYMVRRSDNPLDAFADKLNTRSANPADFASAQSLNYPATSTLHATQLSLELPLYTGGRLVAGMRETGATAEALRLNHERQQQTTAYNTLHAYRSAQAAASALNIANDAVVAARDHAQTTARLARQGRIVASDSLTAELNLASAQGLREQAANRQRLALEALRLVTGLQANTELLLPAWESPTTTSDGGRTESEQRALATRKDIKANEALLKASHARIIAARAAFQPQIGVIAADSWYDDGASLSNKSQSIMGVLSLNLFNGGRDWHGLTAAQREAEQTELQLEGLQQAVRAEVRAAASRLGEANARRQIAAKTVDKARENVRLVKQRYGEGRTILIDLLMAERVLVEARHEELTAGLNQELSAAQLQLAEGSLPLPGDSPGH